MIYTVEKDDSISKLVRSTANTCVTLVTVITGADGARLAIIDKRGNSLRFRGDNLKYSTRDGNKMIQFTGELQCYTLPHHTELHRAIMLESNNRYSLANTRYRQQQAVEGIQLDYDGIVDNMLEFIGRM